MDAVRKMRLALALIFLAGAFVYPLMAGSPGEAGNTGTTKLTQTDLKAKVAEIHKAYQVGTGMDFEEVVEKLKKLAPAPQLQELLADLYSEADPKERITLLAILDKIGVERAVKILPKIATDYALARPKHPNDMSFAGFYVLEKFMHLAWKKLPTKKAEEQKKGETKDVQQTIKDKEPKKVSVDANKLTKVSADGTVHTGSLADRQAIGTFLLEHKLHHLAKKIKAYPIPPAEDFDWVRVLGQHAFVRLRGESSGVDYLFIKTKEGEWSYLAELGHWVN